MLVSAASIVATLLCAAPQSGADSALREAQMLTAANVALRAGRLDEAEASLAGIDEGSRGFEWRHLQLALACARTSPSSGAVYAATRWSFGATPRSLDLSPDDRLLAVGLEDGRALLIDARDGSTLASCATTGAAATVVRFTPDGEGLVVGQADGTLRQHALDGGVRIAYPAWERGIVGVAFDDGRLASIASDGVLRVHGTASAEPLCTLREPGAAGRAFGWLAGDALLVGGGDGRVRSWSARTGDPLAEWPRLDGPVQVLLVAGGRLWIGGSFTARLVAVPADPSQAATTLAGPRTDVLSLACTRDGTRLASGCIDGSVWLHEAASGAVRCALRPAASPIAALDFDRGGNRLVLACMDGSVQVLETEMGVARRAQRDPLPPLPYLEEAAGMRAHQLEKLLLAHIVRDNRPSAHWARVETLGRAGLERFPQSGRLETAIGGAQLRAGETQPALATLESAQQKDRGLPHNLALRTIALARLGRVDDARALRAKLLVLLDEPRWREDEDVRQLVEEAATALASAPRRKPEADAKARDGAGAQPRGGG